jgi:hypothetical protein
MSWWPQGQSIARTIADLLLAGNKVSAGKANAEPACGGSAIVSPSWRQEGGVSEYSKTRSFACPDLPGFAVVRLCKSILGNRYSAVKDGTP